MTTEEFENLQQGRFEFPHHRSIGFRVKRFFLTGSLLIVLGIAVTFWLGGVAVLAWVLSR